MRIGQLLIEKQLLDEQSLEQAVSEQQRSANRQRLGAILIRLGLISEASLYQALSEQLELPIWRHNPEDIAAARHLTITGQALSRSTAHHWEAFLLPCGGEDLLLIARDPLQAGLVEHVQRMHANKHLRLALATQQELSNSLDEVYRDSTGNGRTSSALTDLRQLAQDAPIVEFVATILSRGTDHGASDIHIEPTEQGFEVRYRIDGHLRNKETHSRARFDAVVSRIKLVSGLDIAERRLPQDGRFSTRAAGIDTEVRVSVIPGVHGESIVMRLLPKTAHRRFKLDALGFEPDHLAALLNALQQPDGIILVTGPTGSGKSTTLYAALAATNTADTRVLTVEDPVEYQLPGVTQFQVQTDIGFTFPAALRAILRHDPDTIMVGEIRDPETAAIAIQASLTGHKVLSTLHTNDAPSAFVRLIDIGVEPFLLAASVRTVIAQRLIRRLCRHCASPLNKAELVDKVVSLAEALNLDFTAYAGRQAVGCHHCADTGYRGRVAIHEVLSVTPQLRHILTSPGLSDQIVRKYAPADFRQLQHDALLKFWRGDTSISEVLSLADAQTP